MAEAPHAPAREEIVLDTNVAVAVAKSGGKYYAEDIAGQTPVIAFITAAEIRHSLRNLHYQPTRRNVESWLKATPVLYPDSETLKAWVDQQAWAEKTNHQMGQRPHHADSWIAACAGSRPLLSLDTDFDGLQGLDVIHPERYHTGSKVKRMQFASRTRPPKPRSPQVPKPRADWVMIDAPIAAALVTSSVNEDAMRVAERHRDLLSGKNHAISSFTAAQLRLGAHVGGWSDEQRLGLDRWLGQLDIVYPSSNAATAMFSKVARDCEVGHPITQKDQNDRLWDATLAITNRWSFVTESDVYRDVPHLAVARADDRRDDRNLRRQVATYFQRSDGLPR